MVGGNDQVGSVSSVAGMWVAWPSSWPDIRTSGIISAIKNSRRARSRPPPARLAAITPDAAHLRGIVAGMVRGIIRTGLAGVRIGWAVGGIIGDVPVRWQRACHVYYILYVLHRQ